MKKLNVSGIAEPKSANFCPLIAHPITAQGNKKDS
jgi:hypothetical protein